MATTTMFDKAQNTIFMSYLFLVLTASEMRESQLRYDENPTERNRKKKEKEEQVFDELYEGIGSLIISALKQDAEDVERTKPTDE